MGEMTTAAFSLLAARCSAIARKHRPRTSPADPCSLSFTFLKIAEARSKRLSVMDLEQLLLDKVAEGGEIKDTWDLALELGLEHQVVVGALKSLLVESYLQDEPLSQSFWTLTAEGKAIVENG